MKFCEECGAKLEDDALFCEECGTRVENDESDTNDGFETIGEDFKFCEECGAKNEISAMFCEECGTKFESEPIVEEPEPEVIIEAVEPEPEVESQIEGPEFGPIVEDLEPEAIIEAVEPAPELEPEPEVIIEAIEPESEPEPEVEPQIEEPESEPIVEEPEPEVIIEATEPEPEPEPESEPEAEPQIEEPESESIVVEPEATIEAVEPEPEVTIEAIEPEPEAEPQPKSVKNTEQIVKIDSKPKKKGVFVTILLVLCGILVGTVVEYLVFWRGRNAGDNSAIPTNMPSNMSSEENTQSELTVLDTIKPSDVPELTAAITLKPTVTLEPVNTSIPTTTSEPTATSKPVSTATPKPTFTPTSMPTTAVVKNCNGKHGDIIVKSKLDSEYADYFKVMIGCVDCDELNNVIYVQKDDWNGKWYYFTNSGELKSENIEANHNSAGFIVRYASGVSRFATCKATGEAVEYIEIIYNGDYGDLNSHRTFIADYVEMPLIHDYRCSGFFFVEGTNREKIYVVLTCNDCEKRVEGLMTYNPPKTYADYVIYGDSLTPRINLEYPCIALRCTDGDISVVYETGKYALWLYGAEAKDIPEIKAPDLSKENVPVTTIPVPSLKVAEENKLLNGAVDTSSAYDYSFSAQFDARGKNQFPGSRFADRTPVYFYHPIKIVFYDENVKPAIWVSSDNKVARVYSDGVVEAFSEGFADISAYDAKGHLIDTVKIFTTTKADADPIGSYIDYSDRNAIIRAYKDIPFQDIQESINNITDLVAYMYAHEVSYVMEQEGTSPFQHRSSYGDDWMQTIGSDWLFKNEAGICHNASAAALYSLVGDYERNGIIQMSGDYGHTISWFYENGKYYVYDFTGVYDRVSEINHKYRNNIYAFVMDNIGIGDTLYDALTDCMENSGADFYFKNFVLYSVELTGKDYYPAESNSWLHNSRDIYEKVNKVYFTKGTNVELLYLQDGIKLEMVFIDRDDAGQSMRAYVPPTDTEAITMDTNYGRLRSITLMTLDSYNPGRTKSSTNDIKLPTGVGFNDTYAKGDLRASAITLSYRENGFVSWLANLIDLSDCIVVDFDGTYQFELPEGKKADYYVSSDSNVLRVRSDGVLKAYCEGLANVWACDKNGNVVASHPYIVTTAADLGPLMKTRKGYKDINLEDIPGQLKTITDYACWLYENNVVFDESREPKSPKSVIQDAAKRAIWFPIANSEWVFMDKTGVCCNFTAGADYALCNDYEMTGQIMMCGPYGHVINYYYENGQYYVIDYTKVVEDYDLITVLYHGNAALYVSERIGIGDSIKEAYKDYTSKNERRFYEENPFMYTLNTSGYNFYNTECNNWSSNGVSKNKVNTLYSSTCDLNELFIIKEGYAFDIEPLHKDEIPGSIQTFYNKNEEPSWRYETYFSFCDNPSNLSGTLDGGNANSGGATVNSDRGMDGSGLQIVIEENVTGTLVYDGMWFACYDNKYLSFWGMAGDGIILPERLIIPEEINGLPVKIIGEWSITKTEKLKEIYFPRSIERIGNMNFNSGDYRKFVAYVYEGSFMEEYCKKYNFNYVLR